MISKATVVGAGAMGTCVAQILAANGARVALLAREERVQALLVDRSNKRYLPGVRLAQRILPTADARAAFASTEAIFSAVPCQYLRRVWEPLLKAVPGEVPLCSCTKGVEISTLTRPSQVLRSLPLANSIAVLSGPSVAPEMGRCLPTTVVVAADLPELAAFFQGLLATSWFRVYTSTDTLGVELAGAVKNVIALAAGILDGLRAGDNAKAALITRGLVEITRLGAAMGAQPETFSGLAGLGDLITTCISPVGRNRSAGEAIGRGATLEDVLSGTSSVIEGVPTTRAVLHLAARFDVDMPITRAVHDVLFEQKPPLDAITELMNRPPKSEHW